MPLALARLAGVLHRMPRSIPQVQGELSCLLSIPSRVSLLNSI